MTTATRKILEPDVRNRLLNKHTAGIIDKDVEYIKVSTFLPDPDDLCRADNTSHLPSESTFSYMDIPGCVPWGEPTFFRHSADVREFRIVEGKRKQTFFNRRQDYGWVAEPTDNPKRDKLGDRIPSVPIWEQNLRRVSLNKLLFPLANLCELVNVFTLYMEVGGVFGWRTTQVWFPNERARVRATESEQFAKDLKRTQALRQRLIKETRDMRTDIVYRIRGWKNLHTQADVGQTGRTAIDIIADEPVKIIDADGKPVMMRLQNRAFNGNGNGTMVPMKPNQALSIENYQFSLMPLS